MIPVVRYAAARRCGAYAQRAEPGLERDEIRFDRILHFAK